MSKYRVSWLESRIHYIDLEAEDEFEAIERARQFEYDMTASDDSSFGERVATLIDHDD
ncbi:MAG: hypothetical protein ACT4O9_00600 [Blastocatellia bacterium]